MDQKTSPAPGNPISRAQALALAVAGVAALAIVVAVVLIAPGSSSESARSFVGSAFPNVDSFNTRATGGPISASTVPGLTPAWHVPTRAYEKFASYASSPVIAGGVVYFQDQSSNVRAIDLESGKVLWTKRYGSPIFGPNGVFVANGLVYGTTPTSAFALDQTTGDERWSVPLARNAAEKVDMAPGYRNGLVYVSTAATLDKGGGAGILWALDGRTGKKVWSFDTVPKGLWGNPRINSGGGLTQTPAFDGRGALYAGIIGVGPIAGTNGYPWGSSRPGPNLYTNSIVKLDANTGDLKWYYQLTPHTICNWGLQGPPILLKAGGRDLVIAAGKSGIVIALDQRTGKVVWQRPVGRHNGHDGDGLFAMRGEYTKLRIPLTSYPGAQGGVTAPLSTNGSSVFVPVLNYGSRLVSQRRGKEVGTVTGELVALDAGTGRVEWTQTLSAGTVSATTVVNDLVFAESLDGKIYAFDDKGREIWNTSLPAGANGGIAIDGGNLVAPAELGGSATITDYRLAS